MKIPHTYAEWMDCFDLLKCSGQDAELADCMKKGSIDWIAGVADRYMKQFVDAINYRMNAASESFTKSTRNSAYASENNLISALLKLRKEYRYLVDLIRIPAIPEEYSAKYHAMLIEQVNAIQLSLEESAQRNDRSGKLLRTIRNNRVNNF